MKHIEDTSPFPSGQCPKGNISLEKVASEDNIADILSLPLKRESLNYLRSLWQRGGEDGGRGEGDDGDMVMLVSVVTWRGWRRYGGGDEMKVVVAWEVMSGWLGLRWWCSLWWVAGSGGGWSGRRLAGAAAPKPHRKKREERENEMEASDI
ncbi:hypothetical protein Tco_0796479 [Tanacetum coccineum]